MGFDPYEQHMRVWLRGVQADERARREQRNADLLISKLVWRGYAVRYDETQTRLIAIPPESEQEIVITLSNAREMSPDVLVQWAERVRQQDVIEAR